MRALIRYGPAVLLVAILGLFWIAYFNLAPITIIDCYLIRVSPDVESQITWSEWNRSEGYYGGKPQRKGTVRLGGYDWQFTQLEGPPDYGVYIDRASYEHHLVVGWAVAHVAATVLFAGLLGYLIPVVVAWAYRVGVRAIRPLAK